MWGFRDRGRTNEGAGSTLVCSAPSENPPSWPPSAWSERLDGFMEKLGNGALSAGNRLFCHFSISNEEQMETVAPSKHINQ